MTCRYLIVCKSVHQGNTGRIAERIAALLETQVTDPEDVAAPEDDDLVVGIGSGIYYARFHKTIRAWVKDLPPNTNPKRRVFLFSTSGLPFLSWLYHFPLRHRLRCKGYRVIGEFSCRGHDTFGPLWIIGGLNRKHPNAHDLNRAEAFVRQRLKPLAG